jgi:hypothetical protein
MSLVSLLFGAGAALLPLLQAACDLSPTLAASNSCFRSPRRENSTRESGEVVLSEGQPGSKSAEDNRTRNRSVAPAIVALGFAMGKREPMT